MAEEEIDWIDPNFDPYWVVAQLVGWAAFYGVFIRYAEQYWTAYHKSKPWWAMSAKRSGTFRKNAQDDIVFVSALTMHHFISGGLMQLGAMLMSRDMWRHGYLFELGFELYDCIAMLFKIYPYNSDTMKDGTAKANFFHHAPGLMMWYPLLQSQMDMSPHCRAVGGALLLAGAVSAGTGVYIQTRNFNTQMGQAAAVQAFSTLVFVWARFWVFPKEMYLLYMERGYTSTIVGFVLMMTFNVVVLLELVPKTLRYIQKAKGQKVELETEPVPKSAEQLAQEAKKESKKAK